MEDRICMFYVIRRIKGIINQTEKADDFLKELTYNVGINAIHRHETPEVKKRGRPKKDG
tara:strand:- start:308 stop:484 length:177 start_codon:yes stop_codon:yes gene_type:complete